MQIPGVAPQVTIGITQESACAGERSSLALKPWGSQENQCGPIK